MPDLTTTYLGLNLKNPLVASASPLSKRVDTVKRAEDAGISAVVMYSLFEEQIIHESKALDFFLSRGTNSFAEALTYFPEMDHYNMGPEEYLNHVAALKKAVSIPVIASLNGVSTGGWIDYAKKIEEAGADALELNIYFISTDPDTSGRDLEGAYIDLVDDMRKQVQIPLAVKLSSQFTALPHFANSLVAAGANGLVLFNRFLQPDIDIETLEVIPTLHLSTSDELRLPLRWVAILYDRIKADLALTGGVHTSQDVIKSMMAGANVTMIASEFIANGLKRVPELLTGIEEWMVNFEYESIKQMRGSMSQRSVAEPAAFERANYMKALTSFDNRSNL